MKIDPVAKFINNSKGTQKLLTKVSKNPAVASTIAACVTAGVARPAVIMAMPMKNKEDKKYSAASSIAAGLTELLAAPLIFIPLNKAIGKSGSLLEKSANTIFSNNQKMVQGYKSVTNRCAKMVVAPFIALFRFAAVSPVVKTLFGKDKTGKS